MWHESELQFVGDYMLLFCIFVVVHNYAQGLCVCECIKYIIDSYFIQKFMSHEWLCENVIWYQP